MGMRIMMRMHMHMHTYQVYIFQVAVRVEPKELLNTLQHIYLALV